MTTPTQDWTNEQLLSDAVSKKEIVAYMHENATHDFLVEFKLTGKIASVVKNAKKDSLLEAYNSLFNRKAFRGADELPEDEILAAKSATPVVVAKKVVEEETGPAKFTKNVTKKGDKSGYPRKGSNVGVFYTGYLPNGDVFDTNDNTKKKNNPLRFRVGMGHVVPGFDQAMLSMSRGEKAKVMIPAEHAYGKKGLGSGDKVVIPPNTDLTFDIELVSFD